MAQVTSNITAIGAVTEVEPALYDVVVTLEDGTVGTMRMNVFDLNALKLRLGLSVEC